MLGGTLDIYLTIIFAVLAVIFFMGKGKGVLIRRAKRDAEKTVKRGTAGL